MNRNNQTSNNTIVMIVIFVTTFILIFLVGVLMLLMLERKKVVNNEKEMVISENSTQKTEQAVDQTKEENAQTVQETSAVDVQTANKENISYAAESQTSDETVKYTMYVVNCNNWISLRSSPNTSASRLKEMPLGASCSFIEEASNGFYKVIYNGTTGYALAQYLTTNKADVATSSAAATQTESSKEALRVVNCDEWISLRSSPSTSASRLDKMPLGTCCEYLGTASNGFYRVRYNGTVGYALSQYLDFGSGCPY